MRVVAAMFFLSGCFSAACGTLFIKDPNYAQLGLGMFLIAAVMMVTAAFYLVKAKNEVNEE